MKWCSPEDYLKQDLVEGAPASFDRRGAPEVRLARRTDPPAGSQLPQPDPLPAGAVQNARKIGSMLIKGSILTGLVFASAALVAVVGPGGTLARAASISFLISGMLLLFVGSRILTEK